MRGGAQTGGIDYTLGTDSCLVLYRELTDWLLMSVSVQAKKKNYITVIYYIAGICQNFSIFAYVLPLT